MESTLPYRVNWRRRDGGFKTYDRVLVFSVNIGGNDAHRPRNVWELYRTNRETMHSLASCDPNFQTFGVFQESIKKLEKLVYM